MGAPHTNIGTPESPSSCKPGVPGCLARVGRAYIFNGATGLLVRALDPPAGDKASNINFGNSVQSPGDVDRDGTYDQLVGAPQYDGHGRLYLFSGRTGGLIRTIDPPEAAHSIGVEGFGFQEVTADSPGDVNEDGTPDLYGADPHYHGPAGKTQGKAWVFDGSSGAVLYALSDPTPTACGHFGSSLSSTAYKDGRRPDLYVGAFAHCGGQDGGSYVFSGEDGSLLKALELPAADHDPDDATGAMLGWHVSTPGDLNGDGQPDYVAGAPGADVAGNVNQGRSYVFLSGPE